MADSADSAAGPTAPPDGPQVIAGRYEVIRVIGRGSSARTLLCADLVGDRRVALKELHFEHLGDWKHLELFEREAKVLSLLDHPAIPEVLDFFSEESPSTAVYIVQEFIEGPSLQQRMDAGPMLGQQEVHDLARELLELLDYLHGRAPPVLHRDIKPSNVLVRPDGGAALVDFGGVRYGWRPPDPKGATVIGTFGYMPPEQLVGQAGPASDLYALGATLLHLISGRPPTDFPFESGRIEVPRDLPADASLNRLIEALLRPAPRDRPQSAEAALRILAGESQPDSVEVAPAPAVGVARRRVTVASPHGPRFVDMGEPPRDPRGEFEDVYRNLVNPLYPSRKLWSPQMHVFWIFLSGVIAAVSLGVAPIAYATTVRGRKREYDEVFREGRATQGVIRSSERSGAWATFKYEFEVGDATYVAFMDYAMEMAHYWNEGDHVPVLYDPLDPRRSCFVYR